jgi:DNA-binding GntR family transcriptional regulator
LYAARRVLETSAVRLAPDISPEQLRALKLQADQIDVAIQQEDFGAILDADFGFHVGIISLHRTERLVNFFKSILSELKLGLFLLDRVGDATYSPRAWSADHREVYELLASGNRQQCARVLTRHLTAAEFELIEVVRDRAFGEDDETS